MAHVSYGPIVNAACGSIADITYTESMAGPVVKTKSRQTVNRSSRVLAARSVTTYVSKQWQALTDPQRMAWATAAATRVHSTCLGTKYRPNGYTFFCQVNMSRLNNGGTLLTTPPGVFSNPDLSAVALIPTVTGPATIALAAIWNETSPSADIVVLEAGPTWSFGGDPDAKRLQIIEQFAPGTTPNQDVTSAYVAAFGNLPKSLPYKIRGRFRPLNPSTGIYGCPQDFVLSIGNQTNTPPVTPGSSCAAAPSLPTSTRYDFAGSTGSQQWVLLPVVAGSTYVLTFLSTIASPPATIQAGTSCGTLSTLATLQQQDSITFTATAGNIYLMSTGPWTPGQTWTLLFTQLTWDLPPATISVTPATGPAAGATAFTLTGQNFTRQEVVYFGDTPTLNCTTVSPTSITGQSPAGAAGVVNIRTHGPNGCSPVNAGVTWTYT